jgi:hypothetical protein
MGFLNGRTNNITVDAVLTDVGRQLLARNDGSFQISKFSLGDPEIDYTRIKAYGIPVGTDNITILTPIFEAVTNSSLSNTSRLISAADPSLVYLPVFNTSTTSVSLNEGSSRGGAVSFSLEWAGSTTSIPIELQESTFEVTANNLFVTLLSPTGTSLASRYVSGNRTTYTLRAAFTATGSTAAFTVSSKSLSSTTFASYKSSDGKIHTFVDVVGVNTGIKSQIEVIITET